jgi:hypothetical protein
MPRRPTSKTSDETNHQEKGQHAFLELPDLFSLFRRKHGAPDDNGETGQLRRLNA